MLKNYLIVAIRNLLRNKTYSFINIAGLAVGMAASIIILVYVTYELSYDRFYQNHSRVYRVVLEENTADGSEFQARVSEGVANSLEGSFPEIQSIVVVYPWSGEIDIQADGRYFKENHLVRAGPAFFDVFGYEAVSGDLRTALREPGTAVITESSAERYFGDEEPIGKTIVYEMYEMSEGGFRMVETPFRITAVMVDPPAQTHLPLNVVTHYSQSDELAWSGGRSGVGGTYVLLGEDTDPAAFEGKLAPFVADNVLIRETSIVDGRPVQSDPIRPPEGTYALHLQPVSDIYLFPEYVRTAGTGGNLFFISLFSAIAFIVLLIACLNYVNLSTAQALRRVREVGVRKTVGAGKLQVILQFIGESLLISNIALVIALIVADFFLPSFNAFIRKQIVLNPLVYPAQALVCILVPLITGIAGGLYPALVFSSYQVGSVLKAGQPGQPAGKKTRNVMVIIQFAASIALILVTSVIPWQLELVRNTRGDHGDDEIVLLETFDGEIIDQYAAFRSELLNDPAIVDVTYGVLSEQYTSMRVIRDSAGNNAWIHEIRVAANLPETLGMQPIEGQTFLEYINSGGSERGFLITEKTATLAGLDDPVGQALQGFQGPAGVIIGVLDDYHVQPLYQESEPAALFVYPEGQHNDFLKIMVRVKGNRVSNGMEAIVESWNMFIPGQPPAITFMDEVLDEAYLADIQLGQALSWFTFLAILIGSLGLYGLAAFAAQRRTKEIGIRKVVGASVAQVVTLLSKEFMALVLIANVIAWPIAWYAMRRWLENFAYRIDLSWWLFALSSLLALVIALATVSWQTVRAATANPVEALRYE